MGLGIGEVKDWGEGRREEEVEDYYMDEEGE